LEKNSTNLNNLYKKHKNGWAKTRKIAQIKFSALENIGFKSMFSIYLTISAQFIILSG